MADEELSFKITVNPVEKGDARKLSAKWLQNLENDDHALSPCVDNKQFISEDGSYVPSNRSSQGPTPEPGVGYIAGDAGDNDVFEDFEDSDESSLGDEIFGAGGHEAQSSSFFAADVNASA